MVYQKNEEKNGCCGNEDISRRPTLLVKKYRPQLVWEGTDDDTECEKFKRFVEKNYKLQFKSDREFHSWSIEKFEDYWESVWKYFDLIVSKPYKKVFVKTGPGFLDNDWFTGAEFNFAENILKHRHDEVAVMYEDEEGNKDSVTYSKLFENVRLYAAAFRKHGLKKGDIVACHMSNRLEAVYTMLATLSIGAIFAGSLPFLGAKASAKNIRRVDPKFLIVVDRFQECNKEYDVLSGLPIMVKDVETLERVIIVPSQSTTLSKSISHIKNSCFLHEFLKSGVCEDGTIPELVFEQLPASHPVFFSFTSGTTGNAKGLIHSAWVIFHAMTSISLMGDIKSGDVLFNNFPVGWIPSFFLISCLALRAKYYLYSGSFYYQNNLRNIWDIFSENKVKHALCSPSHVEMLERLNIVPKSSHSFESLRCLFLCASPVKAANINYLYKFLPKTTLISNMYGTTELFGLGTGFYLKSPSYAGEAQLPVLGIDIRCYNDDGFPVMGEMGFIVVATPTPCLPTYMWKDTDKTVINSNYLYRFPGVWCQKDWGWINPVTNGFIFKGRSDDIFLQDGENFGPEDVYTAICDMDELVDYICVAQYREDGDERVVLFVKLKEGCEFTPSLKTKIAEKIEKELYDECVPRVILPIKDIPYNLINKKVENVVRKILASNKIPENINIRNPECLKDYCDIPEILDYYTQ